MKTGRAEKEARISFATPELLWEVLNAKRWELLKVMGGAGLTSIRGLMPSHHEYFELQRCFNYSHRSRRGDRGGWRSQGQFIPLEAKPWERLK